MSVTWFERSELPAAAAARIVATQTVLDIGCGVCPQAYFKPRLHLLCEPFREYVDVLRRWFGDENGVFVVQSTGNHFLPSLPDKSVDTVFMLDLIEHLTKEDGLALVRESQRVARRQVILFTPLGFFRQDYEKDDDRDGWGYKGGAWQRHLSGWEPTDFDATWDLLLCKEYHTVNGKGEKMDPPHGALWAIKTFPAAEASGSKRDAAFGVVLPPGEDHLESMRPFLELLSTAGEPCYVALSSADYGSFAVWELQRFIGARAAGGGQGAPPPFPPPFYRLGEVTEWRSPARSWFADPAAREYASRVEHRARDMARILRAHHCRALVGVIGDALDLPAAQLAAEHCGIPLIVYIHNMELLKRTVDSADVPMNSAHRHALRKAHTVIVPAHELLPAVEQYKINAASLDMLRTTAAPAGTPVFSAWFETVCNRRTGAS